MVKQKLKTSRFRPNVYFSPPMKVFGFFLLLHLKRWLRFLSELGFVRTILVLVVLAMGVRFLQMRFEAGQSYWGLFMIPLIQILQLQRKDFKLMKIIGVKDNVLYSLLYLTLSVPVLVAFLFSKDWVYAGLLLAFCAIMPFTRKTMINPDRWFMSMGNFLPYKYFEWRSGLRQYGLAVSILLLVGLGLSFLPWVVPLVLFFLTLNTSVFYLFGESKELLVACGEHPGALLSNKIKGHLTLFYTMVSPLVLASVIFHHDTTSLLLLVYVLVVSFFASVNAILFKYVSYSPGARFDNNALLQGLMLAFFLVPFLMPVPILMALVNYRRSLKNLKPYFA